MIYLFIFNFYLLWSYIVFKKNKKKSFLKDLPGEIKKMNLGSSHGFYSFDYTEKGSFNGAQDSQTFYYDLKVLKKIYPNIQKGATVFLPVSYFSFSSGELWLPIHSIKYFRSFSLKDFKGRMKFEYILYNFFPLFYSLKKKLNKKKVKPKKTRERRIEGHVKRFRDKTKLKYNEDILSKIIDLLQKKECKIFLITTPFHEVYNSFFPKKELEKDFFDYLNHFADIMNVTYLNYSDNSFITNNIDFFRDFDHLNSDGRKMFLKILSDDLNLEM
ncbi:hypothetical protein [uncultured Ilyobacter sp.]|uniref:hypothetical protein n=1 Tax=uncultured Ilyobacter sp. TaxID=544433 RepID=UPI0029C63D40|nr:hypothetical protein [uncultured Ilyobacter sp.]